MMALPEFSKSTVVREFDAPIVIEEVPISHDIEPGAILEDVVVFWTHALRPSRRVKRDRETRSA
jgi:hypothetical protein